MPQIGTTVVELKNRSSNRPEYLVQNNGTGPVKLDFHQSISFNNDSGLILSGGDAFILSGRLAAAELYAVSGSGTNRILIADPGELS